MNYDLPKSLNVGGIEYEIRSDFRAVLDVIEIINDTDLEEQERFYLALLFFYPDFYEIPPEDYEEALKKCYWFIDGGETERHDRKKPQRLMDWEHDFPYIVAPVNRVIGHEIRADVYLHWWTFLSAYMEIGDCTFAQIVHIRSEKSRSKKLSKYDEEWYRKNRELVDLPVKYSDKDLDLFRKLGGV